jgi:hypothetical protein
MLNVCHPRYGPSHDFQILTLAILAFRITISTTTRHDATATRRARVLGRICRAPQFRRVLALGERLGHHNIAGNLVKIIHKIARKYIVSDFKRE